MSTFREILERKVVLANGASVKLEDAAFHYGTLASYGIDENACVLLSLLREKCLGKQLGDAATQSLVDRGLLQDDGTVDPVLREVVLASVRGDNIITLVSPFTDRFDRAVAEFLDAQEVIRVELGARDGPTFLAESLANQASFDQITGQWAERTRRKRGTNPGSFFPPT